jgi:hypothetical protein
MVGAARRLATELVVIMASAAHEMYVAAGTRVRAFSTGTDPLTGTSAVLMVEHPLTQRSG